MVVKVLDGDVDERRGGQWRGDAGGQWRGSAVLSSNEEFGGQGTKTGLDRKKLGSLTLEQHARGREAAVRQL